MKEIVCLNIKSASDCAADTILEAELVLCPRPRAGTGIRDFQDQDSEALEFIKLRSTGVSVDSWTMALPKKDETGKTLFFLEGKKKKLEALVQLQAGRSTRCAWNAN